MRYIFTAIVVWVFQAQVVCAGGLDEAALRLSRHATISQEAARAEIERVFAVVKAELIEGREVSVKGFGRFYVRDRSARRGRNPKTGAPLEIPARRYPRFISAQAFKAELNPAASPARLGVVALDSVRPEAPAGRSVSGAAPDTPPNPKDPLVLPR